MRLTWVTSAGEFELDESNGIDVLEGLMGLDMPPVELTWDQRISADGASLARQRFAPRVITMPLWFEDEQFARLRVAALASRLVGVGELRVEDANRTRSLFEVRRSGGLDGNETALGTWRQLVLELTAGDPWWYGELQSALLDIAADTPFDDATVDFDDLAAPFNGGGTTQLPVSGDVDAWPLIIIDGPFDELTITELSTGASLQLAAPLTVGQRVFVESRPGRRGPRLDGGSVDWSLLTPASRLFSLPRNAVLALGGLGDDSSSSVEVRWRDRWATP